MSLYDLKIKIQNNYLLPIVRKHRKLADLYYFLFSSDFSREHQKVLEGKFLHLSALKANKPNAFHLRRQVHRLEKGLIMKNRRRSFARDYIGDTVKNYITLNENRHLGGDIDEGLLLWGYSVLTAYFEAVDHDAEIQALHTQFMTCEHPLSIQQAPVKAAPYKRKEAHRSQVSYEDFLSLTKQRRSVRYFLQQEVPKDLLEKAMAAATYSPSACNRQPFYFHVFTEEEKKNKVGALPAGIRPFFKNMPVIMVLVGRLSAYLSERDRHVIYLDGGLASMSFVLALETLGLSSVTINWPDIEYLEGKMDELLPLRPDERPMMLIGVGYADPEGGIPYSQKKTPDQLMRFNELRS
ncbi:MAG: nitroreductase family protein [Nitritalea sp.]